MNPTSVNDSFSQIDVKFDSSVSRPRFLASIISEETMSRNPSIHYHSGLKNSVEHTSPELAPSPTAKKFMVERIPNATKQASKTSFGLFAEFVLSLISNSGNSSKYSELAEYATDEFLKVPGETNLEKSVL